MAKPHFDTPFLALLAKRWTSAGGAACLSVHLTTADRYITMCDSSWWHRPTSTDYLLVTRWKGCEALSIVLNNDKGLSVPGVLRHHPSCSDANANMFDGANNHIHVSLTTRCCACMAHCPGKVHVVCRTSSETCHTMTNQNPHQHLERLVLDKKTTKAAPLLTAWRGARGGGDNGSNIYGIHLLDCLGPFDDQR